MNMTTNAVGKTVQIDYGHSNSLKGPPNGIVQRVGKKGGIDRNYYDENGNQIKQVSNNGHGNKEDEKLGTHGEHAHDYFYNESSELANRSRSRELNDEERKENADII